MKNKNETKSSVGFFMLCLLSVAANIRKCFKRNTSHISNVDRLAARSMIFEHAYCQQSVCASFGKSVLTILKNIATKVNTMVISQYPWRNQ